MTMAIKMSEANPSEKGLEKYDIKVKHDSQGNYVLELPVVMRDKKDAKAFYQDMLRMGQRVETRDMGQERGIFGIVKEGGGLFSGKKKRAAYITYNAKKGYTEIGTFPSDSDMWLLESEAVIDTLIRAGVLGHLLDEYLIKKGFSREEAMKIRCEITPRAGFF
jgi:hypothetical protein